MKIDGGFAKVKGWPALEESSQEEIKSLFDKILNKKTKTPPSGKKTKKMTAKRSPEDKENRPAKKSKASPDSSKKSKKKKDPNAPKKPLSAYMFFSQHIRADLVDENPDGI